MSDNEFITESILGTKEYWEEFYKDELNNFEDCGDCGETWFGSRNTHKIIDWINQNISNKNASICDIGCGNGYILSKLASLGFTFLHGIDYSEKAIEFCKRMYSSNFIQFDVVNILQESISLEKSFDVLVDKGTYDAICLMPDSDIQLNKQLYVKFLLKYLKPKSYFIIMSCNFTKEELDKVLLLNNEFEFVHEFETPSLTFGGHTGKQVTGLALRKCV